MPSFAGDSSIKESFPKIKIIIVLIIVVLNNISTFHNYILRNSYL